MRLPRITIGFSLLAVFCCLMISSAAVASGDKDQVPTAENLWKAKQNKDLKEVERIRAILEQEAQKFRRSPANDDFPPELMPVSPPQKFEPLLKSFNWGNDVTIATGSMEEGISAEYFSDDLYAVRCTTYNGVANAGMKIYKSTDEGATWFYLNGLATMTSQFSYPVIMAVEDGGGLLYLFYLRASNNGELRVARYSHSGDYHGAWDIKSGSDTITYFSACSNLPSGDYLMVAYQKDPMGSATPDVYTIVSLEHNGEVWHGQVWIDNDGSHPDLAYGSGGYVFLTYERTAGADDEIHFARSTNSCDPSSWGYFEALTADSWDDNYPKVAALHTTPSATPHVWVAYNHDAGSGNIDLRFAYSTNGGGDWSKNHILANTLNYNEMACDLWVGRKSSILYVNVCYLAYRDISYLQRWYDIYWGFCNKINPATWHTLTIINDNWGAWHHDGRKVCQGTYGDIASYESGVVFAGHTLDDNYVGLYFDSRYWTDVEDEVVEERVPGEFSLLDNYPNPFNPETIIQYTVGCRQTGPVRLVVYNVLGQLVRTLVNEPKEPGTYEVIWDGKDKNGNEVASGVYFYKLEAEDFSQTKKMVLMK